jgi:MFS family permease
MAEEYNTVVGEVVRDCTESVKSLASESKDFGKDRSILSQAENKEAPTTEIQSALTFRRLAALFSLNLLFVTAAMPTFFIGASLCTARSHFANELEVYVEADIGGSSSVSWVVMANSIATAASAPFAGAISDLFGRRHVGLVGCILVGVGMTMVGTAREINVVIGGTALVGVGAGFSEVVAAAGILELAPVRSRGKYMGLAFLIFLPLGPTQTYG